MIRLKTYITLPFLAVLVFAGCVSNEGFVGTWTILPQSGRSVSGTWQYDTNATGDIGTLCADADIEALAYEITGTVTVFYATSGRKYYQVEYANGKRHGNWCMWYPDGGVMSTGQFERGDLSGLWTWRAPGGQVQQAVDWAKVHALAPSPPTGPYGVPEAETMTRYADRIALFGPYPSHLIEPFLLTNVSIVGEWGDTEPGMVFTRIKVSPNPAGSYDVRIESAGCLAQYEFTNRATFTNGVLRLDNPVCTYSSEPFRNAYIVGTAESPLLFPESGLVALEREIEENGDSGAGSWINLHGEPRIPEIKPSQQPPERDSVPAAH